MYLSDCIDFEVIWQHAVKVSIEGLKESLANFNSKNEPEDFEKVSNAFESKILAFVEDEDNEFSIDNSDCEIDTENNTIVFSFSCLDTAANESNGSAEYSYIFITFDYAEELFVDFECCS